MYKDIWQAIPRKAFWLGLSVLAVLLIAEIAGTALIPTTRKLVIDSLMAYNWNFFVIAVGMSLGNSLVLSGAQSLKLWSTYRVAFIIREAATKFLLFKWAKVGWHSNISTPAGRINDDIRLATEQLLGTSVEVVISVVIVLSLLVSILKWPFLAAAAVVYSVASISIAGLFKSKMISIKDDLLSAEAAQRQVLTRLTPFQTDLNLDGLWFALKHQYRRCIDINRNYRMFNAIQSAIMYSLPFMIMAPGYFAHHYTLGEVTQGTLTFDLLVLNSTIWVQLYPQIIEAQTSLKRVKEMYQDVN